MKRLFYGDVATGSRQQGGQKQRYKYTLKKSLKQLQINSATWEDLAQDRPAKSLKQLQINPATWEDLAQDRPAGRRSVKTSAAIY
ncbi:unnamed protein product [Schistocephalus solidus]|uniref:Uncharacterized protein n=1 Tax=Schistocephalus solidus TaxID=70667 RepID=A0A183SMU9_SCHSO|nr:unnamed protein product [Schistocephalus solidus]